MTGSATGQHGVASVIRGSSQAFLGLSHSRVSAGPRHARPRLPERIRHSIELSAQEFGAYRTTRGVVGGVGLGETVFHRRACHGSRTQPAVFHHRVYPVPDVYQLLLSIEPCAGPESDSYNSKPFGTSAPRRYQHFRRCCQLGLLEVAPRRAGGLGRAAEEPLKAELDERTGHARRRGRQLRHRRYRAHLPRESGVIATRATRLRCSRGDRPLGMVLREVAHQCCRAST